MKGVIGAIILAAGLASPLTAQVEFANFCSTSSFTLNGNAAGFNPNGDCVLRLTNGLGQSGSAFLTSTFSLASDASFSTAFSFRIDDPVGSSDGDGQGADGLVFVVQTVASTVGGSGGGIGYSGIADSVGIEIDTWNNGSGLGDPDGNHVGIDLEGNISSVVTGSIPTRFNDGAIWYAWVDYNGTTDLLEVRVSNTPLRPLSATVSTTVDLVTVLGQTDAFIGFTSGTGAAGGDHQILTWRFVGEFDPIDQAEVEQVPTTSEWGLLILATLLAGAAFIRMRL